MSEAMLTIHEAVQLLRREGDRLAEAMPLAGLSSMKFSCELADEGASAEEIGMIPDGCHFDIKEFWRDARFAKLFEDREYGQWGLEILTPRRAIEATEMFKNSRHKDFLVGDFVVGKFIGDSDLLVIRCDENAEDYGRAIIALPLDRRSDWDHAAESFVRFLNLYIRASGNKFWLANH